MERRYGALNDEMSQPEVLTDARRMRALGREQAELQEPVAVYRQLQTVEAQLAEARELLAAGADAGRAGLAGEGAQDPGRRRADLVAQLTDLLRPRAPTTRAT